MGGYILKFFLVSFLLKSNFHKFFFLVCLLAFLSPSFSFSINIIYSFHYQLHVLCGWQLFSLFEDGPPSPHSFAQVPMKFLIYQHIGFDNQATNLPPP